MPPLGLVHHPDAVAQADARVQLHYGRPARRTRVAVRDAHRNRLLQGEDVLQSRVIGEGVEKTLLDGPRIAEQILDVICEQLFEDGVTASASARRLTCCHLTGLRDRKSTRLNSSHVE